MPWYPAAFFMAHPNDILITAAGVVSPIGIGITEFWSGLRSGRNGISWRKGFENGNSPVAIAGMIRDFDGRQFIKPRKAIKVMCQEIQFGHAVAMMAFDSSGISPEQFDMERFSVIWGAETFQAEPEEVVSAVAACTHEGQFDFALWGELSMKQIQPLWMLKYLPNMVASHISIAINATGPNNTICQGDASSALAMIEAATLLDRGWADAAMAGGTGSRVQLNCQAGRLTSGLTTGFTTPETASRPFHPQRNGFVCGEGAAAVLLETRQSMESRGGHSLGRIAGWARAYCPRWQDPDALVDSIVDTANQAMFRAGVESSRLQHVNASASGKVLDDAAEAVAIGRIAPDAPVVALKSFFGNTGAGTAALEILGGVLALQEQTVPPTRNAGDWAANMGLNLLQRAAHNAGDAVLKLSLSENGHVVAIVLLRD